MPSIELAITNKTLLILEPLIRGLLKGVVIWTNYIFQTRETLEGIQLLELTSSCKYM